MLYYNNMLQDNSYYVYAHSTSQSEDIDNVFYIGKGKGDRAKRHNHRNNYWQNKVKKNGGFYIHYLYKNLTENEAQELEKLYISIMGKVADGGLLVNMTDGGEGISGHKLSEEAKRKISDSKKGKKISEELRERYKIIFAGEKNPRYKATVNNETRSKISAANKGKLSYEKHPKWAGIIQQFDLYGRFINEYKTSSEAEKYTGISQSSIRCVINENNKRQTAGGFIWRRKTVK